MTKFDAGFARPVGPARCPDNACRNPPGLRGLLAIAVTVVVVAGLSLGRSVMIPITLGVLLSFLLAPLVKGDQMRGGAAAWIAAPIGTLLRRGHLGRVPSVQLAVLLALAAIWHSAA